MQPSGPQTNQDMPNPVAEDEVIINESNSL